MPISSNPVDSSASANAVVRVGTTLDGNVAVWNGDSVDGIRDGGTIGIGFRGARLNADTSIKSFAISAGVYDFNLVFNGANGLMYIENNAADDFSINFCARIYDDGAPININTPTGEADDVLIAAQSTPIYLTPDGTADAAYALANNNEEQIFRILANAQASSSNSGILIEFSLLKAFTFIAMKGNYQLLQAEALQNE